MGKTIEQWDNEPDKLTGSECGLSTLILRNPSGCLCGYVGVPKEHPLYGKHYTHDDVNNTQVHGGLIFSEQMHESQGVKPGLWWFGFDCAHVGDYIPTMNEYSAMRTGKYRDIEYVKEECESLAKQLSEYDW